MAIQRNRPPVSQSPGLQIRGALTAALLLAMPGGALAQETTAASEEAGVEAAAAPAPAGLAIELNALQDHNGACRMIFVTTAPAGSDLTTFALETVLFDRAGRVSALTLLDFREAPAGRTRVRSFDMAGRACADIGRVLFNSVASCAPAEAGACGVAPVTSSLVEGVELLQ